VKRTILLVEDDANDVFFMHRAMKQAGVTNPMQVARDGQMAIDYISGAGAYSDRLMFPLPDLVLLDLKLPHVMGLDVLEWIRTQPELAMVMVLILTSSRLPTDVNKAYSLGANSYLVKPSLPEGLLDMVGQIKRYWLDLNEPARGIGDIEYPLQPAGMVQQAGM
jgi:CheY-like chemotaxis protein